MSKPQLPQGTRDFNAAVVQRRQYIFQTIRTVFELYGFQPLETPAMENLETLMGKYGEEGDKLIFKILNNGLDNPTKLASATTGFEKVLAGKSSADLTERALRYDLTIPFARFVAMNQGQLIFPFKRYQIQPVWRADRPQKGRYREFTQCDCDMVGSKSLLNEVELLHIYATVFNRLGLEVEIQINHRSILSALAEVCGGPHLLTAITTAIDKIDKIGLEKVQSELVHAGLTEKAIDIVTRYLQLEGTHEQKMASLAMLTQEHPLMLAGAADLNYLHQMGPWPAGIQVVTKPTLARGLNYYTGTIFEVKALHAAMGSIGGGGRYDDLTGLFDVPGIPGVGISFGVDRIYDVLEQLQLFPNSVACGTKVLFVNLGAEESGVAYAAMQAIRKKGIASEIYPDAVKLDKQFKYADKKSIPYAIIIGSNEMQEGVCKIKNLTSGNQETLSIASLSDYPFQ